jgi:uncharacterized membrane protein YbhN (UPF0104 family)
VRVLRWVLAVVACAFVAWVVPFHDRCWDARSPHTPHAKTTRDDRNGGCTLHLDTGDVRIDAAQCAQLQCEPGIVSTVRHARIGLVAALLALYGAGTLAWAARWRALLDLARLDVPLASVWRVSIEAQAGGILLPGGIGGDALRIASIAARRPNRMAIVIASVLLDRVVGLSVVAGGAASLAFALGGLQAGPLAVVLAALPLLVLVGMVLVRNAPLERMGWLFEGRLGRVARPVLDYLRDPRAPRAIAAAAAVSVVVAAVQFIAIRGLVFALGGVPTAEKWVYVGTAMAFVVAALPALPGAWGTADAAYVFFFGLAGLRPGTSLAVCLMYRLFWYLSGVAGAILHLLHRENPSA